MSELFEPVDAHDARYAQGSGRADDELGAANSAGVVTAADVHVARTVGSLGGEADGRVLLAVALTSRAVRGGSVCLDLSTTPQLAEETGLGWPSPEDWQDLVTASPLVDVGVVHVEGSLVYLDRYHEQETQVLDDLTARAATTPPCDLDLLERSLARVFPESSYDEQRAGGAAAATRWTTVLTGGPGTGKTTAVAGLLVALADQHAARGEPLRIALAAPTGKAAARLQEAVHASAASFAPEDRARITGLEASTLHRLLRPLPGSSTRFRRDRGNRLPHDVVVVDESSMVSLTMMARLLEAVRPDARLVLVGDPDQLSSVDAGAVLSDLVRGYDGRPDSPVTSLRTAHRYGAEIGALAEALRRGDADAALEVLAAGHEAVEWVTADDPAAAVRATALPAALAIHDAARAGDAARALSALERHRLLCAHRDGPFGVSVWNHRVEQWLAAESGDPLHERSYVGRPLLLTANDYALGVYNGDTGVVVATSDGPRVHLATAEGVRDYAPSRLGDVDTMHAMTIHKSQGSQAEVVTVLLPDEDSRLLTRELFYTAVTRARDKVRVVGPEPAVRAAIARRAQRASGLAQRLR